MANLHLCGRGHKITSWCRGSPNLHPGGRPGSQNCPFLIIPSSSAGAMYPPVSHIGHKMVLWQLVHLVGGSSYITILCHRMSFFSSSVHLSALVTFVELNSTLLCSAAPGGVWFLPAPPPRTDVNCESSCYITPQIAVTWGVEQHRPRQSRFNYLPAEPQTLRYRHPPDNFCQILLARQEALDGEGQWSRGRRLRRSKSSGITSATAQNENIFQSSVSFLNG